MNRFILLSLLASAALAAHADTYFDNAQVRSVQAQYESVVVPRQECTSQWINEPQRIERSRNYGGAVVGGLAGALVGNQVGNGHGREAATALGAVIGAFTGDRVGNRDRGDERRHADVREVLARVVAGLVRPQRSRARWRGVASASGWASTSAASAALSTSIAD